MIGRPYPDGNTQGDYLTTQKCYASFMLRLRQVQTGHQSTWVISAESAQTGEIRWFANVDALFRFISEEFCDDAAGKDSSRGMTQDAQPSSASNQDSQAPDRQ